MSTLNESVDYTGVKTMKSEVKQNDEQETPVTRMTKSGGRCEPIRLTGRVAGVSVEFLCDTGAESSILSLQYLERLPRNVRMQFLDRTTAEIVMTNGHSAHAFGPVLCEI